MKGEKNKKKNNESSGDLWDTSRKLSFTLLLSQRREKDKGAEGIFY